MIGEALEITIVVSMLVLVGYPGTFMVLEALRVRRRRRVRVVRSAGVATIASTGAPTAAPTGAEPTLRGVW